MSLLAALLETQASLLISRWKDLVGGPSDAADQTLSLDHATIVRGMVGALRGHPPAWWSAPSEAAHSQGLRCIEAPVRSYIALHGLVIDLAYEHGVGISPEDMRVLLGFSSKAAGARITEPGWPAEPPAPGLPPRGLSPTKKDPTMNHPVPLDPEAPGLDEDTRRWRRILAEMEQMSPEEIFALAVRAGIYTEDGELTPPYRDDAEPSACRPTD